MTVLLPRAIAAFTASKTTAAGSPSGRPDTIGTSMRAAHVSSCSMAAARNVPAAARSGVAPASLSRFASFAAVVVLPLPFTPTTRITRGDAGARFRLGSLDASSATSTSRTASSALGTVFSVPVVTRSRTCAISGSTSDTDRSARRRASSSSSRNSGVIGSSALREKRRDRNPPRVFASSRTRLGSRSPSLPRRSTTRRAPGGASACSAGPLAMLVELVQLQRDHFRNAAVVHRDAVEHVGGLDRPAVVRDDDELRAVGELAQRLREAPDIALVERGVDLVEDAERRRLHPQDRKEQRRCGEGALAARQLRERTDALAGRPRVDVDARLV